MAADQSSASLLSASFLKNPSSSASSSSSTAILNVENFNNLNSNFNLNLNANGNGSGNMIDVEKNFHKLPNILTTRFHDWICALTDPKIGAFPNGISPKQLDRLAHRQIAECVAKGEKPDLRPIWKSTNHLGVMLWSEVKAGRIIRVQKACYVGAVHYKGDSSSFDQGHSSANHEPPPPKLTPEIPIDSTVTVIAKNPTYIPVLEQQKQMESNRCLVANAQNYFCRMCKQGYNSLESAVEHEILRCVECAYQIHLRCAYSTTSAPENLSKKLPWALSKWRCYDCKRCELCGDKDDSGGLLLCDGCDCGEHMGCQVPRINDVPPAPWFCLNCRTMQTNSSSVQVERPIATAIVINVAAVDNLGSSASAHVSTSTADKISETISSPASLQSPRSIMRIENRAIVSESKKSTTPTNDLVVSSPDCPSNQSDPDTILQHPNLQREKSGSYDWRKISSPPMSDETPEVGQQKRKVSDEPAVSALQNDGRHMRKRLGKSGPDGQWVVEGISSGQPPRTRRRDYSSVGVSDEAMISQTPTPDEPKEKKSRSNSASSREEFKANFRSRRSTRDNDESTSLPFLSEDLPLLNDDEAKNIQSAKYWTVDETCGFLERMGYGDSVRAFRREEIDGAAMLLLKREDVLLNLGLKLGPALKTYKFVNYIQATVRSSSN